MATDDAQVSARGVEIVRSVAAVGTLAAMTAVAYFVFEEPAFGVLVGATMGAGTYFHLPYVFALEQEDAETGADGIDADDVSGFHPGAAGFALEAGGVGAFALGFALGVGIEALAGGAALAVVAYVVLAAVLPRQPAY